MNHKHLSKKAYNTLSFAQTILTIILWGGVLFSFIGIAKVPSESMFPTLNINEMIFYRFVDADELEYDDVVLFYPYATETTKQPKNAWSVLLQTDNRNFPIYIKRLIGKPGDTIVIKEGYVWRNGVCLEPDYLVAPTLGEETVYEIPEGYYFLMGDNRQNSYDCRYIGPILSNGLFGKMIGHIAPWRSQI